MTTFDFRPLIKAHVGGAVVFTAMRDDLDWLQKQFEQLEREVTEGYLDNTFDNHRIYLVGNIESDKRYAAAQRRGCCGSIDRIVKSPYSGNTYGLGLNFGH